MHTGTAQNACRSPTSPTFHPPNNAKFDGTTTYGSNFTQHALPERPHFEGPVHRPQARFEGTTTNQDTYKAHRIEPRAQVGGSVAEKPHIPFNATTTNQV